MSGLIQRILSLSRHARPGLRPSLFSSFFFFFIRQRMCCSLYGCSFSVVLCTGVHFRFGSVFIKKSNQTEFFKKKPKPVQTDRFGSVLNSKNRFKPVWLGFFRFGFSGSRLKKSKPNRTCRFFQNFNRFFFTVRFFWLFFFQFSWFNRFFSFFKHP